MFTYPGGFDPSAYPEPFGSRYRTHLHHLKLKGLQPKTIDAYTRTIRRMGEYFDHQIDRPFAGEGAEKIISEEVGQTGLVQQTVQIVASHDLTLLVGPQAEIMRSSLLPAFFPPNP